MPLSLGGEYVGWYEANGGGLLAGGLGEGKNWSSGFMGGVKGCCGTPDCDGGCSVWCPGGGGEDWRRCCFLDDFGDFLLPALPFLLPSEPARLSRSAMRSFIFLPAVGGLATLEKGCYCDRAKDHLR